MKTNTLLFATAALLWSPASAANTTLTGAKVVSSCPAKNQLCFSVSIPPTSASSGKGDIYFQIQAPASYEWAALGQGLEMAGSSIFIIYANAAKTNVTLSPRLGISEVEPEYNSSAKGFELIAGSGIANGLMTANVRCSACASWSGGNMSFSNPASPWIWAYKTGSPLDTDSLSASLALHDNYGAMTLDLTQAVGGSADVNPFVKQNGKATTVSGSSAGALSGSSGGGGSGGSTSSTASAHGILMGTTMLLLFPLGVLLRRLIPTLSIWMHAAIQGVALILTIVGVALGVSLGNQTGKNGSSHAVLGIVILIFMLCQPILGVIQHRHFRKYQTRSVFGWMHRGLGGLAMLLAVVNGGLGLQLSDTIATSAGNTYILAAAVLGCVFMTTYAATAYSKRIPSKYRKKTQRPRKHRSWLQLDERTERPPPYLHQYGQKSDMQSIS